MTVPSLTVTSSPAAQADADVVLLAARKGADGPELLAADGFEWVAAALATMGATGAADELTRLPGSGNGPRVVAVAGVGERADAASLRSPPEPPSGNSATPLPSRSPCRPTTPRPLPHCSRGPLSAPTPTTSTAPTRSRR